uniref:Putative endonuclease n=1 Tax=Siphoviridae sp. ctmqu18 TaxID=2825655 RepID=A0A8S5V660_9CAUD|nr:MAG TPA: putative endonuclease [Siphoviridae sp. ctmqu18]
MISKFNALCKEYRENKRLIEELEALQDGIKSDILDIMGGRDVLIDGADKVTYKEIESRRLDSNRLKKEEPGLYERYSTVQSYKRFSVY